MVPMLDDLGSPACYYWLNTFDELQYLFVNLVGGLRILRRDLLRCSSCPLMGRKPANKWYLDISWPSVCAHVVIFPSIKISISVDPSSFKLHQYYHYRQEWRKGLRAVLYLCLGQFTGLAHRGITLMDCTETVPVSLPMIAWLYQTIHMPQVYLMSFMSWKQWIYPHPLSSFSNYPWQSIHWLQKSGKRGFSWRYMVSVILGYTLLAGGQ